MKRHLTLCSAAGFLALTFASPGQAAFTCDSSSLEGADCTVSTVQAVSGDTTVAGNLTITETGALQYGSFSATIEVGGNLQVDGEISADGAKGDPGEDGGDLTIIVGGNAVISALGLVSANGGNGSKGGNGSGGGNGGPTAGGDGDDGSPGGDGGSGGSITFEVCGDFTVEFDDSEQISGEVTANAGKGGNGGNGGKGGNSTGNPQNRGAGGDGGDGGDGGLGGDGGIITVSADGQITLDGVVNALGHIGGNGANGGGSGNGNPDGTAGTDGDDGDDGAITLNTAQSGVDTTGADIDPDATIAVDQAQICGQDPLPDGTVSHSQGFYGSTPNPLEEGGGEATVEPILNDADNAEGLCQEIEDILLAVATDDGYSDVDCSTEAGQDAVALFITGTVGNDGGNNDDGFLPSGIDPGENLAAQKITLLLNLNLGSQLEDPKIPLAAGYFINIDPVQDLVDGAPGTTYDPVLTTGGKLGTCTDSEPDGVCDAAPSLTALGTVVAALDTAGTTLQDILDAADAIIAGGADPQTVNTVSVSKGDLTDILGLINESFDEEITGFVTAFDAD